MPTAPSPRRPPVQPSGAPPPGRGGPPGPSGQVCSTCRLPRATGRLFCPRCGSAYVPLTLPQPRPVADEGRTHRQRWGLLWPNRVVRSIGAVAALAAVGLGSYAVASGSGPRLAGSAYNLVALTALTPVPDVRAEVEGSEVVGYEPRRAVDLMSSSAWATTWLQDQPPVGQDSGDCAVASDAGSAAGVLRLRPAESTTVAGLYVVAGLAQEDPRRDQYWTPRTLFFEFRREASASTCVAWSPAADGTGQLLRVWEPDVVEVRVHVAAAEPPQAPGVAPDVPPDLVVLDEVRLLRR